MKFRLTVTSRAHDDINRNADWWAAKHSLEQALKWADAVYDQLESVLQFPKSHSLSLENGEFPYEIRDKLVGLGSRPRYRAVFTVRGDEIFVLAVRAGQEDRLTPDDVEVVG